jgi:hypothetical protein
MLAVLSFLLYAGTLFTLPQVLDNQYVCERSSVAAAASNVIFGTPLLMVDSDVIDYFLEALKDPLQNVLDETMAAGVRQAGKPLGSLQKTTRDGNGVGYSLVATAAFRLFGLHVWALPLAMLVLMAGSAAAFFGRFSGPLAGVVILYFVVLTLMLFTPLVWNQWYANQIPVGGIRFFSLVTLLPAFHILLDLLDAPSAQGRARVKGILMLGVQTAILVIAALVRGSAIPLLGTIGLVWLILAWRHRREPGWIQPLVRKALTIGVVGIAVLGVIMVSMPRQYLTDGRFQPQIWHRITLSLGANPYWPWPGVAEMFDCKKYVPKGIEPGMPDSNGHCIWFDYVTKHHIPISTIGDKTYGGEYETALRQGFFKIVWHYPKEVLTAFIYYKPQWIIWSIKDSLRTNFSANPATTVDYTVHFPQPVTPYSPVTILLLIGSLMALVFYLINAVTVSLSIFKRIFGVASILALSTIPAYIAVWALPYSSADLLFFCLFLPGLGFETILAAAWWALRRSASVSPPG